MSKKPDSAVTALDPDTFDLDAWIDGVKPLQQTITLYSRGDLMPRIDELVAKIQALPASAEARADQSLGSKSERDQLREQLREIWAKYEASGLVVALQQISNDVLETLMEQVAEQFPAVDSEDPAAVEQTTMRRENALGMAVLGASVVDVGPEAGTRVPITAEHLKLLSRKLPPTEFSRLTTAASALAFTGQVGAPFSQRVSHALTGSDTD